jgi:hypothetical protein
MNNHPVDLVPCQPSGPVPRQTSVPFAARLFLLLLLLAIPLLGCSSGPKGVTITGQVVGLDSKSLGEQDVLQVSVESAEEGKTFGDGTKVEPDMTFTLSGPKKNGVPPGKYKVTLAYTPYTVGGPDSKAHAELKAALKGISGKIDVGSSDMAIVIDAKKKTVTTK